jgi:hypothetical protein
VLPGARLLGGRPRGAAGCPAAHPATLAPAHRPRLCAPGAHPRGPAVAAAAAPAAVHELGAQRLGGLHRLLLRPRAPHASGGAGQAPAAEAPGGAAVHLGPGGGGGAARPRSPGHPGDAVVGVDLRGRAREPRHRRGESAPGRHAALPGLGPGAPHPGLHRRAGLLGRASAARGGGSGAGPRRQAGQPRGAALGGAGLRSARAPACWACPSCSRWACGPGPAPCIG